MHSVNIKLSENLEIVSLLYRAEPENLQIIVDNVTKDPDEL
jgi:hypothetical protein